MNTPSKPKYVECKTNAEVKTLQCFISDSDHPNIYRVSQKQAEVKDEMDGDEDEDDGCDGVCDVVLLCVMVCEMFCVMVCMIQNDTLSSYDL